MSTSEGISWDNSTGRLIPSTLLSVASFEREVTVERIKAGMDAAEADGKPLGRPRDEKRLSRIRRMNNQGATLIEIADKLRCSRQNVYAALAKTA